MKKGVSLQALRVFLKLKSLASSAQQIGSFKGPKEIICFVALIMGVVYQKVGMIMQNFSAHFARPTFSTPLSKILHTPLNLTITLSLRMWKFQDLL